MRSRVLTSIVAAGLLSAPLLSAPPTRAVVADSAPVAATIAERVVKIIVDALHVPDADVIPAADLRHDLGADSIDIVELVMALEKAFDLSIPDTACEEMLTVGSIISYVEHHSAH